ncbi:hypothetical protein KY289_020128 [Solanum tuberosum]|nr:hypothetical protein KY289_020128 [Solanum tuberosum]
MELCATMTELEIINSLKVIREDKAPGIYGYNVVFLKKAWNIIKEDVTGAVQHFFITGKIYRNINYIAVTVVPKVSNPMNIKEYIPIVCCTVMYKVIGKILATRLQKVVFTIINPTQAGFVPGRRIGDNIVMAHELVMQELDFSNQFISWIMECVKTISYSILVNGEPTKPFPPAKGLRQGDPMSPFLFAIAMEYLSRCLTTLVGVKQFKFHSRCAKLQITHLCFADDVCKQTWGKTAYILERAAIAKTHWALAKKEDKVWIRWVHSYYIKGLQLETMRVQSNKATLHALAEPKT